MTEIRVPEGLWNEEEIPEGAVSSWLYQDGEAVEEGSTVATIMAEKTEYDITAPMSGTLRIKVEQDSAVTPGSVIGTVE